MISLLLLDGASALVLQPDIAIPTRAWSHLRAERGAVSGTQMIDWWTPPVAAVGKDKSTGKSAKIGAKRRQSPFERKRKGSGSNQAVPKQKRKLTFEEQKKKREAGIKALKSMAALIKSRKQSAAEYQAEVAAYEAQQRRALAMEGEASPAELATARSQAGREAGADDGVPDAGKLARTFAALAVARAELAVLRKKDEFAEGLQQKRREMTKVINKLTGE